MTDFNGSIFFKSGEVQRAPRPIEVSPLEGDRIFTISH